VHDSNKSDHYLLDILISGLDSWFKGSTLSPDCYPHHYHHLIAKQTAIGWGHLFNGHLTLEWCTKQDYYVHHKKIIMITHTGAGWSLCTLTILWTDFFTLWKARNDVIHGHDQSAQQQACCHKLCTEMKLLHSYHDKGLASDTDTFIGNSPVDLTQYLDMASASQVQSPKLALHMEASHHVQFHCSTKGYFHPRGQSNDNLFFDSEPNYN
jgi:hypothetical protein